MKRWILRIDIKECITDDDGDAAAEYAIMSIRELISTAIPESWRQNFGDIDAILSEMEDVDDMNWANSILESLYDWADENSVWLGP